MTLFTEKRDGPILPPTLTGARLYPGARYGTALAGCCATLKETKIWWDTLASRGESDDTEGNYCTHKRIEFSHPLSWALALIYFYYGGFIFFFCSLFSIIVKSVIDKSTVFFTDPGVVIALFLLLAIGVVSRKLLDSGKVVPRVWAYANRAEGTIWSYPSRGSEPVIRDFSEYLGFSYSSVSGQNQTTDYDLWVCHESEPLWFRSGIHTLSRGPICFEWDFIQEYMDKSKPMPDVPALEPYRKLDPVTAAWDEKNGRPEYLFRHMPNKTFDRLSGYASRYANEFPWGNARISRESAIAQGWVPPPEKFWTLVPEKALTDESALNDSVEPVQPKEQDIPPKKKATGVSLKEKRLVEKEKKQARREGK